MATIPVSLVVTVERGHFGSFVMDVKLADRSVMYEMLTAQTQGQAESDALDLLARRLGMALEPERETSW